MIGSGKLKNWKRGIDKTNTVDEYLNKCGELKFSGSKHLKHTQAFPWKFGQRIMQIRPHMIASAVGKPQWDENLDAPDPIDIYSSCHFDDLWEDAAMPEVVQYLRGNKSLKLPPVWRAALPKAL